MKKISVLFLLSIVLILSINVISAANDTDIDSSTNTTVQKAVKTSVSTPDTGFIYKKNSFMKITIKDKSTNESIKNLKIKVKVYTKKKAKTYTLKTDNNGVAKLPTKKIKLGRHKFIINTTNSSYKVSKKDILFIGYKKTINLEINKHKKLKSKDAITVFLQKKNGQYKKGIYTDVWYAGDDADINPHHTMILKSKLYFKNKKTGKIISKTTKGKLFLYNGEIYRTQPEYKLVPGYKPIKAKIWYLTSI